MGSCTGLAASTGRAAARNGLCDDSLEDDPRLPVLYDAANGLVLAAVACADTAARAGWAGAVCGAASERRYASSSSSSFAAPLRAIPR